LGDAGQGREVLLERILFATQAKVLIVAQLANDLYPAKAIRGLVEKFARALERIG
jgi:hypothetical protein